MKTIISLLFVAATLNAGAASIDKISTRSLKSSTLKSVVKGAKELVERDDAPMSQADDAVLQIRAFKIKRHSRESVSTAINQLVSEYSEGEVEISGTKELTKPNHAMRMAILDAFMLEFMDEGLTEAYDKAQFEFIDDLVQKVKRSKNVQLYQVNYFSETTNDELGIRGRGVVVYKKNRREAVFIEVYEIGSDF